MHCFTSNFEQGTFKNFAPPTVAAFFLMMGNFSSLSVDYVERIDIQKAYLQSKQRSARFFGHMS